MLRKSFQKQYFLVRGERQAPAPRDVKDIPDFCVKCPSCGEILLEEEYDKAFRVCHKCGHHGRMTAPARLENLFDDGQYQTFDDQMKTLNPLAFPGYEEKIEKYQKHSDLNEAVVVATGTIDGVRTVAAVMDSRFMMGSMGSVVGEKVTRAVEMATEQKCPLVVYSASGGARMQEGIVSLMQMAKTSAALGRHGKAGLPYVSILTDPTTGGVTASFAMLGDIILAEPGALIGFAGPRVIEQTIKQKLPEGFQSAEFLLEHGFVDRIVPRADMKRAIGTILKLHGGESDE